MKIFLFNSLNIFPLNIITLFPEEALPFQIVPPLGLFSLAGSIKHMPECKTRIVDLNYEAFSLNSTVENLFSDLYQRVKSVISIEKGSNGRFLAGFQTLCTSHHVAVYLSKQIREDFPESFILFGGPQSSAVADETMELFPHIDFILSGEADFTFPVFVETLLYKQPLESVKGLHYRSASGTIRRTPEAVPPDDLDSLPFPDYDCYPYPVAGFLVEAGRGCPNNCSFCFTGKFFSRRCRYKSVGRIEKELGMLKEKFGSLGTISFQHDNLFGNTQEARKLCDFLSMLTKKLEFNWNCFIRLDALQAPGMGDLLKNARCKKIFIGIESGSENIQKKIQKYRNVSRAYEIIPHLLGKGLKLDLGYMFEFPDETPDDVEKTLKLIAFTRLHDVNFQINPLMIYSGTAMFNEYRDSLIYDPHRDTTDYNERFFPSQDTHVMFELSPTIFSVFYSIPLKHPEIKGLATLSHFIIRSFVNTCLAIICWSGRINKIIDICFELKPYWSANRVEFMENFEQWIFGKFKDCRPVTEIFRYEKDCFDCALTDKYAKRLTCDQDGMRKLIESQGWRKLKSGVGDRVVTRRYGMSPPMVSENFKRALKGAVIPEIPLDESDSVYFIKGVVRKEEKSFNIEVYKYPGISEQVFRALTDNDHTVGESVDSLARKIPYSEILKWLFLFFEKQLISLTPA